MQYLRYLLIATAVPAIFLSCWIASFYLQLGTPVEAHIHKRHERYTDKQIVLERHKDDRKIVIISGSNALYGLNARTMENRLGIVAINMAVNAHAGLRYYFSKIKPHLNKGDIAILPIEYLLLDDEFNTQEFPKDTRLLILREDPEFFFTLSFIEKLRLIFSIHYTSLLSGFIAPLPQEKRDYRYLSDDSGWRGDVVNDVYHRPGKFVNRKQPTFTFPDKNIHRRHIREFVNWAKEKGIVVIGAYPAYVYSNGLFSDQANRAFFSRVTTFWEELGVTVFGSPREAMYQKELLASYYHLTTKGRSIHTEKMIKFLQQYLGGVHR